MLRPAGSCSFLYSATGIHWPQINEGRKGLGRWHGTALVSPQPRWFYFSHSYRSKAALSRTVMDAFAVVQPVTDNRLPDRDDSPALWLASLAYWRASKRRFATSQVRLAAGSLLLG